MFNNFMNLFRNFIRRSPLLTFFVFVFIISWGIIFLLAGPDGFPVTQQQAVQLGMAILLGPSIAGLLMTGLSSGRSGFRVLVSRLFRWKFSIRWYALALLTAPLSTAVMVGILSVFSGEFKPVILISDNKTNLVLLAIIAGLMVGTFEELGWTGFAIPRMNTRYNFFHTGVIVGLFWGAWHFPLFWEADSFSVLIPFMLLIARLFSWLPAYRVLMVWVYKNTESLLLVILMHLSLVSTLLILDPIIKGEYLLVFILVRGAIFWGISVVITKIYHGRTEKLSG
jgi:membrane protease YdiL (CAAX protease family)